MACGGFALTPFCHGGADTSGMGKLVCIRDRRCKGAKVALRRRLGVGLFAVGSGRQQHALACAKLGVQRTCKNTFDNETFEGVWMRESKAPSVSMLKVRRGVSNAEILRVCILEQSKVSIATNSFANSSCYAGLPSALTQKVLEMHSFFVLGVFAGLLGIRQEASSTKGCWGISSQQQEITNEGNSLAIQNSTCLQKG
eukprot:2942028-Amphidinium_carterae.1